MHVYKLTSQLPRILLFSLVVQKYAGRLTEDILV